MNRSLSLAASALLSAGCYPDLSGALDPGPPPSDAPTELETTGDGATLLQIDATDYDLWVYVDLDGFTFVDEGDPTWDLGFRRFEIKLNGGVSGGAGVEASSTEDPFDAVTSPPDTGWATDEADADGDEVPEYALLDWYAYDYDTHELSPVPLTWVIATSEGQHVKLRFDGYYDDNGTPAMIRAIAEQLEAP